MMLPIQNMFAHVSYVKIFIFSLLSIVVGFGFAAILLPKIIQMAMKMQLRVTPETMARELYEEIPFPFNFKLYIFNVTNKDDVLNGEKPILQEIGPYHFEEYKNKVDIVDNNEDDTMEYDFRNTYYFKPEPNGLTGNETVTIAHMFILSTLQMINIDRPELLDFVNKGINGILHNPKDTFFTGRLWDFLYDGIDLDCSSDELAATAVCSELDSGVYKEIRRFNETAFKFSMFFHMNGSIGRFKVFRGKNNIKNLGRILEHNGISEMDTWNEDECNQISGTDGTVYPPFLAKEEGFTFFIPQICKEMTAEYQNPSKYAGIKTNHFTYSFDVSKYGSPNCYCRDEESCPPEGILDLYPCINLPIGLSKPHFYQVDPAIREKVLGLSPDPKKHEYYMDFYQLSGSPVQAKHRFQINSEIVPLKAIPHMKRLQPMYLPLLWFETGYDMPRKYVNMLKYQLVLALKFQKIMKYGCFIIGVLGLVFGAIAFYVQSYPERNVVSADTDGTVKSYTNHKVRSVKVINNNE